jgi:hypothetical protein
MWETTSCCHLLQLPAPPSPIVALVPIDVAILIPN